MRRWEEEGRRTRLGSNLREWLEAGRGGCGVSEGRDREGEYFGGGRG